MDDLIKRLRDGVVEHDKRWSGDTHDDLGGSANYEATESIMAEAAEALADAQATIARMEAALRIARGHVAHSIEEWGVDDETSAAMKEDLRVIESALSQHEGEG